MSVNPLKPCSTNKLCSIVFADATSIDVGIKKKPRQVSYEEKFKILDIYKNDYSNFN